MNFKQVVLSLGVISVLSSCTDYTLSVSSSITNSSNFNPDVVQLFMDHNVVYENFGEIPEVDQGKIFIDVYYRMTIEIDIAPESLTKLPAGGLKDTRLEVCFGDNEELLDMNRNVLDGYVLGGGSLSFNNVAEPNKQTCVETFFVLNQSFSNEVQKIWFRVFMDSLNNANPRQTITFDFDSSNLNYDIWVNNSSNGLYNTYFQIEPGIYSDFAVDILFSGDYKTIRIYIPVGNRKIGIRAYSALDSTVLYISEILLEPAEYPQFDLETNRYIDVNIFELMVVAVAGAQYALGINAIFEIKAYASLNYQEQIREVPLNPSAEL
jgi:hypothetical protein